ncbi:DUF4352 domain-containing protein [Acrocarpospora catenulata]|uniref:DUF4352 domain-containing protein n=1 Tax=Acrocarpospora catenulata TaxID=2836182 RepID=UPI001BDB6364|nr:DUF4352 domain-containing protein [Acrocarpospora catenulata]
MAALTLLGSCAVIVAVIRPSTTVVTEPDAARERITQATSETAAAEQPPAQTEPTADAQPATAPPADAPAAIGSAITLSGMKSTLKVAVTVTRVIPGTPKNQFLKPDAGNRWVAVELELANVGQDVYSDSPSNGAYLIDSEGQQYRTTFGEVQEGVSFGGSVTVSTGDRRKGVLVFEVPESARLAKFQFALNSGFADQKGEWLVG